MSKQFHVIVPAAGTGSRFGGASPKQYLTLLGRPLIFHTLQVLCEQPDIADVNVVIAPDDVQWDQYDWSALGPRLNVLRCGGASRAESVANGLQQLHQRGVPDQHWVLVHDAARPCLSQSSLQRMLAQLADDAVGGILAVPVADTLKRSDAQQRVADTLSREGLWQAQTPQMFRLSMLQTALCNYPSVTDEAGAIEAAGYAPKLVAGDLSNLKVTYPADLQLAAAILVARENQNV